MPATYRLSTIIDDLASGQAANGASFTNIAEQKESDGSTTLIFFQQGQVVNVYAVGVDVLVGGALVAADPATDEPFTAGQLVYVSQTQGGGWIVHGSVKA